MNPEIAILGWGSLLWDGGADFDASHEPWMFDGPALKLEFSRVSKSRQGALTLVLDPENGTWNRVAYCLSKRSTLADAIEDLRRREGTSNQNIGYTVLPENRARCRYADQCQSIRQWAMTKGFYAGVWTDLPSNFAEKVGNAFSIKAALTYLAMLPPPGRRQAEDYFSRAPSFIDTPLRAALQMSEWRTVADR